MAWTNYSRRLWPPAAGWRLGIPTTWTAPQSITCGTTGRDVILTAELGSVPLEGLLLLS